ncbi:glycerol kinase GlpK [Aestuariispira insulae]|uniref:Glycerol kinase n=1 Tax=Aestuariispira insulae TaxID=1461337 RepID=A0A3D9H474_9PROT|nr:glycerol kinase GlpK [Aestuariispira insulae]RED44269.1 glycerol kinase [Aestuariispira insulae]
MSQDRLILAIDQGTTSSRAIVFDESGSIRAVAQQEFPQHFPNDGWVEHDPEDIWDSTLEVCRAALSKVNIEKVVSVGITNQRETTVVWDRATGKAIYNAIVWQDRRTAAICAGLRDAGHSETVTERSGLLLDPYFSGTKAAWILDNVEGARAKAEAGELAFGTIDSFLLWRLTGGQVHATDATNASRTNLYNIHTAQWDPKLLEIFNVPEAILPTVQDCASDFGQTEASLFGRSLPIGGIAGDQQAAAIGQCCFEPGMIKSTYGTGCFVILNTGEKAVRSNNRLLTTVGYRLDGKTTYAIEGAIFVAGAAVQWLRDGLGLIKSASETEDLVKSTDGNHGVYLVPAFTGLGAPYWDPDARGAIFGLTRDTGPKEFVRAALESVCYQTFDLFEAMAEDGVRPKALRVDGGMVSNDWVTQYLSDILNIEVDRPVITETTALGAAYLAGLQAGIFESLEDIASKWGCERSFLPNMEDSDRNRLTANWRDAVSRIRKN